jgi:dTDP-4-dehydrorhamnose reductase
MDDRKRVLITGASGFLGWNLCRYAATTCAVTGVFRTHPLAVDGVAGEQCDLTVYRECKELLQRARPHAVIHAAAEADPNRCQERPEETGRINVAAAVSLAGLCSDAGIPLAFISTDLVFDGTSPPYNERSIPSPVNRYGEQKLAAERETLARHGAAVICRMPLMFGDAPSGARSFILPMIRALRDRTPATLFTDEFRTPASGRSAAAGVLLALEKASGILHLGGRERISRYDFGLKLARACGINDPVIHAARQRDVGMAAPRPPDVSLDSSRAFALGYDPLSIDRELSRLECVAACIG